MRRLVILVMLLVLAASPQARADGDPASDVLLLQDAYFPYPPGVPGPLQKTINDLLKTTRKAGFPLKVAIIADHKDLGAVPQYFGKPQDYAPFLQSEIAFNSKKPLLVVMPVGYGLAALPKGSGIGLEGLDPPKSASGQDLGTAAVTAIVKLSAAAGHRVPTPKIPTSGGGSGGSTSPVILFGVPFALLVLGGLLFTLRQRQDPET